MKKQKHLKQDIKQEKNQRNTRVKESVAENKKTKQSLNLNLEIHKTKMFRMHKKAMKTIIEK